MDYLYDLDLRRWGGEEEGGTIGYSSDSQYSLPEVFGGPTKACSIVVMRGPKCLVFGEADVL